MSQQPPPYPNQPPPYQQQPPYRGQPPYQGYGQPRGGWQQPPAILGPAPGVSFASHGARLGACILDAIIVGIILTALFVALLIAVGSMMDWTAMTRLHETSTPREVSSAFEPLFALILAMLLISLLSLLYFPLFWARGGQTPGMMMAGIRVVRDRDGGSIGWGAAILRLMGYLVSAAVFYLGFVWILIDGRRRGWHDLIAGTCVIAAR